MDERPDNSQQLMDILLIMDKEEKIIQAVSGVQDGKLQTKNPLEDNNDLLRVDRHGDMFSNFFPISGIRLKIPPASIFPCPGRGSATGSGRFPADRAEPHARRTGTHGTVRSTTAPAGTTTKPATGTTCHRTTTATDRCSTTTTTTAGTAATAAVQVRREQD